GGRISFQHALEDLRLMLTERHDDNLLRLQDRADAHRDRLERHVLFAAEGARRVDASDGVEDHLPRLARAAASGLIEADVSGTADAQQLQVDAAGSFDLPFVLFAERLDFVGLQVAARNVNVSLWNVHMVEERLAHPTVVTVD